MNQEVIINQEIQLSHLFKNIINKDSIGLVNQNLVLNISIPEIIKFGDIFYYRNKTEENKIIFKSKDDDLNKIEISDFILKYKTKKIDKKYIKNCCKKYKKRNYLEKRLNLINNEIDRAMCIKIKIKTEIIYNFNFNKNNKKSHFMNCLNKILDKNIYDKPLFLYDLHNLNLETKKNLLKYIKNYLNIELDPNIYLNSDSKKSLEILYVYLAVCKILENIELYINYLNVSKENITKNLFCLNKKYFMFNDILYDRILEDDESFLDKKKFSKFYIFRDYNTYAIDNSNKRFSNGYILALANNNKWNVFPVKNNDQMLSVSKENLNNYVDLIKEYEKIGISLLEKHFK